MELSIESLRGEHREIEAALVCLAVGVRSGAFDIEAIRSIHRRCVRHYEHEEAFLVRLSASDAALAAKLRGQHDETLELAVCLQEAVNAGPSNDIEYLARRLLAITQHNIIEEERDVFPLASRKNAVEEPPES